MDFDFTQRAEEFRAEVRVFLDEHHEPNWKTKIGIPEDTDHEDPATGGIDHPYLREWDRKLFRAGLNGILWPSEFGGRGFGPLELFVFEEELSKAGAPRRLNFFGDTLLGPTLTVWGADEQKARFLPPILSGDEVWCQGFSEPNAGSDLAALTTRAIRDGDEWVISGQKVWTTLAHIADYIFMLVRTDPDVPKHAGISYMLVPMNQDGITIRPLKQPTGTSEFNEVFFDEARCAVDNIVGGVNNGWRVAMTTLGFERGSSATSQFFRFENELKRIIALAKSTPGSRGATKADDPLVRQDLAHAYAKVKIMRAYGYRMLTSMMTQGEIGPEASLNKMMWSEYHRWITEVAMNITGPASQIVGPDYTFAPLQHTYWFSKSETIWGGTAEIQRNIVGERILGLPKEPKPAKTSS